jgi:hypothetical protein
VEDYVIDICLSLSMTCKFIALGYGYRSLWLIALAFNCKSFCSRIVINKKIEIHIQKKKKSLSVKKIGVKI